MDRRRDRREDAHSYPTYSRLFIVSDKNNTVDQYREAFCKFGTIEDIRLPRDHVTDEPKGVAFIKFSKTSEAAAALRDMHMKKLDGSEKRLKIMVASSKSEIPSEDDEEKYKRLFITVPRSMNEENIKDVFSAYGDIENVKMQRDRDSGDSRGFAYVKYRTFYDAAIAFEQCDSMYRAIFAMPRNSNRRQETLFESNINSVAMSSHNIKNSMFSAMNVKPAGYTKIQFVCSPLLSKPQVMRIFDIVPGMVDFHYYIHIMENCGKGKVSYSNPVSAAYAVEKLNRFEYPPGVAIFVRADSDFLPHEENFPKIPSAVNNLKTAIASSVNSTPDLAQLAEAIAEASKLIKAAAGVKDGKNPDSNDLNYCSVQLPPTKPLADIDSPLAKRCFLVCKPQPPSLTVLRDIFCRFGDLINVYTLPGKTVGFARYASASAADNAIETLHGAVICGVRIKVLEAEEEVPSKRAKYDN